MNPKKKPLSGHLAYFLYIILPAKERSTVGSFLTTFEKSRLLNTKKEKLNTEIISSLQSILIKTRKNKSNHAFVISYMYLAVHLFFVGYSLLEGNIIIATTSLLYGAAGFIFFQKKSSLYFKLRFSVRPFILEYWIYSTLGYCIILLSLGYFNIAGESGSTILLFIVQASLLAPFFEELFFRDVLFTVFQDLNIPEAGVLILTAILFSFVHWHDQMQIIEFLVYIGAGIILGSLRLLSGSLIYSILTHSAVNLTMIFL